MKRIFCLTLVLFASMMLIACDDSETTIASELTTNLTSVDITTEPITTTEEPTTLVTTLSTIDFNFDGYLGSGTIADPYVIDITVEESFSKAINFSVLANPLTYIEGNIEGGVFTAIDTGSTPGIEIEDSNDFSLTVETFTVGEFYIMISSLDANPTYVKVNVEEYELDFNKNLKVLAIGNSFSVDGMEYLYKIADSYGVENITLGILYIPGASLATHVNSIENTLNNYVYYKNSNDVWSYANSSASVLDGLLDEDWDIISIQQVSSYSGVPSTYNEDITTIIDYVNDNKTNEAAEIVWHMTWAYQGDSTHPNFVTYSSDQMVMYNAIISTVQSEIDVRNDISYVIPSGTSIQNIRTSYMGDTLTRDGYHLSLQDGRYAAGLTWFAKITGFSIDNILYKPIGVSELDAAAIKASVNSAVENPYVITNSVYLVPES